jgi:hypothetical protein
MGKVKISVKQSQLWPGLWPGVSAIVGDAELLCVPCAKWRYGAAPVQHVIDGGSEREPSADQWGNVLSVVLHGSEDLHGEYCGRCHEPICDEDCICYQPGQAEHWNQYGTFFDESERG